MHRTIVKQRWVVAAGLGLSLVATVASAMERPLPASPSHQQADTPQRRLVIYLQPLEPAPDAAVLAAIEAGLRAFYPVEVRRLPVTAMPPAAWFKPQARWNADTVLPWLKQQLPADGDKVLGVTTADIFTRDRKRGNWGVLGLGYVGGAANVISTYRARRGVDSQRMRERIAKVAVHEVGHNFGLDHCASKRPCLMDDANGTVKSTDRETDLCAGCRKVLAEQGIAVPEHPGAPWL